MAHAPDSLIDFDIHHVSVEMNTNDMPSLSGLAVGSKIRGLIGSRSEPLIATFGMAPPYAGSKPSARSTLDLKASPELLEKIMSIVSKIEDHPLTPNWARNLNSPIRNDYVRIKVGKMVQVTLMEDGKIIGEGCLADLVPGSRVVACVRFDDPWELSNKDGSMMAGVSLGCEALLIEKPPPVVPMVW